MQKISFNDIINIRMFGRNLVLHKFEARPPFFVPLPEIIKFQVIFMSNN
jgi:hypothetical protein